MVTMDEFEHVCPLCCEELDLSDREFYPCKCGYQVCMWCWHRIRESETGLCPACRTPYGEDPHQFTALDVEEVLKANKEAQAAAKRERQQQQHQHHHHQHSSSGDAGGGIDDQFGSASAMDVPKDRSSLANMRVIRRNLVYAVGLPPSLASEEILRKPEYFGQYGKIAKIVLNRSNTVVPEGNDPRRASASAYVTFVHKQDTLACILALDGFYLENRNIRASYGTSKYCSAFIKSVRCNNPECTYLHEMGAAEDTFTKQEIQAGYVTSGRDVLARQQQIVAEQMKHHQGSGTPHIPPRKRVGGGGPSGTGKASSNPIFPAPEYDEPPKQGPPLVPPPSGIARSSTTQATMTPAQQAAMLNPATIAAKLGRSSSVGAPPGPTSRSNGSATPTQRKSIASVAATAASVVAAGRPATKDAPDSYQQHSTLTALTPLKRATAKGGSGKANHSDEKVATIRNGKKQNKTSVAVAKAATAAVSAADTSSSIAPQLSDSAASSVASVGGEVIGGTGKSSHEGVTTVNSSTSLDSASALNDLGGTPIPISSPISSSSGNHGSGAAALLGGEVFDGPLQGKSRSNSAIGSSKIGGLPLASASVSPDGTDNAAFPRNSSNIWNGGSAPGPNSNSTGVIGSNFGGSNSSTSALASILGINLPTGSGSLQEASSLWNPAPQPSNYSQSPLAALNGTPMSSMNPIGGGMGMPIGGAPTPGQSGGSSLIGGVPIGGGPTLSGSGTLAMGSGGGGGASAKSDIALLQSLLPGVHITSDHNSFGFGGRGQNYASSGQPMNNAGIGGEILGGPSGWVGAGGGGNRVPTHGSAAVGAIGQNTDRQNVNQGTGMW